MERLTAHRWFPNHKIIAVLLTAVVLAGIAWALGWELTPEAFFGLVMVAVGAGYATPEPRP